MKPKEVLEKWIDCFNKADAYHIAELYATNSEFFKLLYLKVVNI